MKKKQRIVWNRIIAIFAAAGLAFSLLPGVTVSHAENLTGAEYDEISVDPIEQKDGYSSVLYSSQNGLPTSEANAITETKEGFIWIGSYSGLIRYDGNNFERIDSVSTGITSVVSLYVDSQDRLWIGTNDNGVIVMKDGVFTRYNRIGGMMSSSIRSITEDNDGNIYIASTHGIGIFDSEMNFEMLDETQIYDEYVQELRRTPSGVIYGKTLSGAIFTIESRRVTGFYDSTRLGMENIKTILPDDNNPGYIYVGTEHSEVYYGNITSGMKNMQVYDVSPLKHVNSMEMVGGQLWICADNGIGTLSDGDINVLSGLQMNNSIDQMLVDYEGNLWFISSRQGVMKIVKNPFSDIFERYNVNNAVVNSTCIYSKKLFVGTDNGLIVLNTAGRVKKFPVMEVKAKNKALTEYDDLIALLDGIRIRSIIRDSQGRVWFSTYGNRGLVMYDGRDVTCYTTEDGLPSERVRAVCEGKDGKTFIACTGGLAILDEKKGIEDVFDDRAGLSNSEILTVAQADNGDLILGSDGDGIYIISDGVISNVGFEEGLSSEVILRIKKDEKRGIFWIVTSNSIAYMTEDHHVTTVKNFPYSNNFDLVENSKGEMWVLSSNGIYVAKTDQLLANEEVQTVFYNYDNGLPCVATANSYSDISDDGNLYIAGASGVVKVNIEKPLDEVEEIKMAVPYIEADGELIYSSDNHFVVPAKTRRITVYGYVYTYSLMNPKITYMLRGFDKDQTTVSRSEFEPVDYTNLKGGTYKFVMNLQDEMGRGNNELVVTIEKEKAIYEKLWFIILCIVLAIALILGIVLAYVRSRVARLEKKQTENKIFIREMIEAFAKTIDMKDKYTNGHSSRVAQYTVMLAKELGYDEETVDKYYNIALLHDIGKIGVPPEVLNKQGKLTDQEFAIIKSHSKLGYDALKDISIMPELAIGAGAHHERPDGKGYPRGLKGNEIPRVAQIIAVADTFDAMYSDRPYRKRMNFDKAVSIIKEVSGTQLEEDVVEAFLRLVDKGEFRAPDDDGGGSTEDINNIHKKQDEAEDAKREETKAEEKKEGTKESKPEEEGGPKEG